jgi:hypothetical protein
MTEWPHGFGPAVRQCSMAKSRGGAKLLISRLGSKNEEKGGTGFPLHPLRAHMNDQRTPLLKVSTTPTKCTAQRTKPVAHVTFGNIPGSNYSKVLCLFFIRNAF